MSHAIDPESVDNENAKLSNDQAQSPGSAGDAGVQEMKTQEKMKVMAAQLKTKSKANAKKLSSKTKDRLSLEGQLRQARIALERFVHPKVLNRALTQDTIIPKWVLKKAKGIVFLTVVKAGFLFAGNVGTGCVIVRKPNGGWTGPSSIAVAGVSFGFLAGASKVDHIMILPDDNAVKQFTGNGQLRLGGEIQVALGPIGREGSGSVGAGDKGLSVVFSYSHAQGLYGGLAFDGKIISVRPDCNDKYYGRKATGLDILTGAIDAPLNEDYDVIVHLLDGYCNDDLTPMTGERISIDDLDRQTNASNFDGDSKEQGNGSDRQSPRGRAPKPPNANGNAAAQSPVGSERRTEDKNASEILDEIGAKFQSGFNSFKSMFKQKGPSAAAYEQTGNIGNASNVGSDDTGSGVMKSANDSGNNMNIGSLSPQSSTSSSSSSSDGVDQHRPPY